MRDYSKVAPQFWIGKTGKALRAKGMEAQVVAMYLLTSPHANMLGLYYVPMMYIAHEAGLGIEGARKGLIGAIEAGFCRYDEASEVVWVIEMAAYQIAPSLEGKDKRIQGVQNEYDSVPDNPYLPMFYDKYGEAFKMTSQRHYEVAETSPIEAPSKPLASQEQEQEQEQKKEQEQGCAVATLPVAPKKRTGADGDETALQAACRVTWNAYKQAYIQRYGTEPIRDAKANTCIKSFVQSVGFDEAPHIAQFYVGHNKSFYVQRSHEPSMLKSDAAGLRTEWATGRRVTVNAAREADRLQDAGDMWNRIIDDHEQKDSSHG